MAGRPKLAAWFEVPHEASLSLSLSCLWVFIDFIIISSFPVPVGAHYFSLALESSIIIFSHRTLYGDTDKKTIFVTSSWKHKALLCAFVLATSENA